jgi:DNA repair proteins
VLPLTADGVPRAPITVAEGSPDCCPLDMRRLAECVLRAEAASFILAHNHAGSNCEPSDADLSSTSMVRDTFARLGVPLREHYVVAGRAYARCFSKLADYLHTT